MSSFGAIVEWENDQEDDNEEQKQVRKEKSVTQNIIFKCRRYWCTEKAVKRCLPILTWLPKYSRIDLKGDIIAGVTVALTVIPQGLAYAQLALLPPQYGLYTAFMGCFVYMIFGSSKDLTIGPTAVLSLMISEYVYIGGIPYAILLSFFCGCIQLIMGLLNLGFFINFVSAPVLSGFVSAAAIIIAINQLKGLFGLSYKSHGFIDTVYKFFVNIHTTNYWDFLMGSICIVLLLLMRHFKDRKIKQESKLPLTVRKLFDSAWWTIATGRNALLVVISAIVAYLLIAFDKNALTLTKEVEATLPSFSFPQFTLTIYHNETQILTYKSFFQVISDLGSGIIVIPFVSVIEAIAIAKAFSKGKKLNATQEIIALGFCNVFGSFVSSYPTTASFSRSAINNASGVRTPLGAIFTGCLVLFALGIIAPFFKYIPKACLCAIVFSAVIFMVHYQDVISIWKTNKIDLLPLSATFICSFLLGLEFGILIGAAISLLIYLYQQSQLKMNINVSMLPEGITCMYVKPDKNILYPSIEYVSSKLAKELSVAESLPEVIIFDCKYITKADYTTSMGFKHIVDSLKSQDILLIFTNLTNQVEKILVGSCPAYFHHCRSESEIKSCINESIVSKQNKEKQDIKINVPLNGTVSSIVTPHQRNSKTRDQIETTDPVNQTLLSEVVTEDKSTVL
ncbi:sodium-independent sulfate anion transporter-like isoform X1 [Centruroides sculpturatus]|uniref:sodium-independent sulfate anion transporter-like isoform X1 n=2 Tax=Centruroides sculpturatus TaxID=218467 RepID=UPI000C6DB7FD|nr:sodium-independent sulfate anion transporter-like isoform X1 [Centruroides sculpturatus]